MATATKTRAAGPQVAENKGDVVVIAPPRLAYPPALKDEFGVGPSEWRTLIESIYPAAKSIEAVNMALAYCKQRGLDIFKRPVHIVPIYNSSLRKMVETVWPGINELRTTAMRTKNYAGMDVPTYGPDLEHTFKGGRISQWRNGDQSWIDDKGITLKFPEWCQITVYRLLHGQRMAFPGPRVYWLETYATKGQSTDNPNTMWEKRSNGQLDKCAEAAALRRAFPEEIGDDHVPEEIGAFHTHNAVDVTDQGSATVAEPQRKDYEESAAVSPADAGQAVNSPPTAGGSDRKAGRSIPAEPEAAAPPAHEEKADKSQLTDVDDLNEEPAPLTFETYTRVGDFFAFADTWLEDHARTEAELVAFGSFYHEYMLKMMDHKNPAIRSAVDDTKQIYGAALTRASKR